MFAQKSLIQNHSKLYNLLFIMRKRELPLNWFWSENKSHFNIVMVMNSIEQFFFLWNASGLYESNAAINTKHLSKTFSRLSQFFPSVIYSEDQRRDGDEKKEAFVLETKHIASNGYYIKKKSFDVQYKSNLMRNIFFSLLCAYESWSGKKNKCNMEIFFYFPLLRWEKICAMAKQNELNTNYEK